MKDFFLQEKDAKYQGKLWLEIYMGTNALTNLLKLTTRRC